MRLLETLALITAGLAANIAVAQTSSFDTPETGARIRLSLMGAPANTATVLARSNDSLVVEWDANGRRDSIAMHNVTRLEISRGRSRHVKRGALIGFGVGAVIGVFEKVSMDHSAEDVRDKSCTTDVLTCLVGQPAASGVSAAGSVLIPVFMLAGTGVGALIGSHSSDQWQQATLHRVDTRVGLVPTLSTRGVALVVSGRF